MKIVTVLFLIATPIFISSALAENVGLDKIVVTPYRMEIHSENSSLSTEEIDVREAEKKGVSLLKNVLAESSSIVSASSGGLGGDTSIFLRGHNSHHTRFMLDGIKIYDPISTTAYYSFTHFHLQGIEEIEISKGPQSSLYGSDAIGGVISLFTKKGIGEPKFSFKQKVGSYNTYEESLDFSGEHKNLGYYLGIARTDIGGFSLAKEKNNNTERDPYHNLNASLRLDYEPSDKTTLNLITRYIYAKYEYDGSSWTPPYLPTDDNDNYAYDNEAIVGFKLKQYINDKLDYKLILSKTNVYRKSWEDISSDSYYLGDTYQVDNQLDLKLADCYKIIIGFDYLREKGDSYRVDSGTVSDFPKETANNRGYFIENILEPAENLNFAFSYRRDEHSTFEDEETYRIAGSYLISPIKTKLKASFGTGFKAPSIYQLHAPATAWGPIGNSSLNPEESQSYEVGIEKDMTDKLKIECNYFRSQLKNLIDYSFTEGYVNMTKARIEGLEVGFDYYLNEYLSLALDYTWLDTENKDNHMELARRPSNKATFRIKSQLDKLSTYFDISYVGHRFSDTAGTQMLKSYILGNLSLNYKLRDNLDIFTRFENILNDKYEEITGYQTAKFSAYAGMKIVF